MICAGGRRSIWRWCESIQLRSMQLVTCRSKSRLPQMECGKVFHQSFHADSRHLDNRFRLAVCANFSPSELDYIKGQTCCQSPLVLLHRNGSPLCDIWPLDMLPLLSSELQGNCPFIMIAWIGIHFVLTCPAFYDVDTFLEFET